MGLLLAVVLALLLGVPTLRLRADYLAIVTIAAAEIIRQTLGSVSLLEYFGGQDGLTGFSDSFRSLNPFSGSIGIPGVVSWRANDAWVMLVGWILVVICCLIVWLLMRSRGAASSSRSVRTRTPCAASARTSTRTRCSR